MRMQTSKPRTRSKMMWLLFAAPLLVLLGWVGRKCYDNQQEYYENHKPVVTIRLAGEELPGAAKFVELNPYQNLSKLLDKRPNAQEFVINWYIAIYATDGLSGSLTYNRQKGTLKDLTQLNTRQILQSWDKVNDKAIRLAAIGESRLHNTKNPSLTDVGPDYELHKFGARLIKHWP